MLPGFLILDDLSLRLNWEFLETNERINSENMVLGIYGYHKKQVL